MVGVQMGGIWPLKKYLSSLNSYANNSLIQ